MKLLKMLHKCYCVSSSVFSSLVAPPLNLTAKRFCVCNFSNKTISISCTVKFRSPHLSIQRHTCSAACQSPQCPVPASHTVLLLHSVCLFCPLFCSCPFLTIFSRMDSQYTLIVKVLRLILCRLISRFFP